MTGNSVDRQPVDRPADDQPRFWQTRGFALAAGLLAAILVLGLALSAGVIFGGSDSRPTPAAAAPATTAPAAPSGTASDDPSVCGLTAVEMTGTVATAPAATWALVGTIAAPSIAGQGPGRIDADGYRSCYARTPTGALLAAATDIALGSNAGLRKQFYERAMAPGPGRDALLKQPVAGESAGGTRIQIAGFRVLRYTGNQADVDIAIQTSTGAYGAMVMNLQWSQGDWLLRLADDGNELSALSQIPSLAGYILWSGV